MKYIVLYISFFLLIYPFQQKDSSDFQKLTLKIKNNTFDYNVFGVYIMQGEDLVVEVVSSNQAIKINHPGITKMKGKKWKFSKQDSSKFDNIIISDTLSGESITLNVFTKVPYSRMKKGRINNYRIDEYPSIPWKGNPKYSRPEGFIEVTKENKDTKISPHFTLGQFLCKQESKYPKYLLIRERLIMKLEYLLKEVNSKGYPASTFFIMSGYRTPFYNVAIGNVKYSRHVYGDAADIFIDEDKNGKIDDLNNDGLIDEKDVDILHDIIEKSSQKESYKPYIGGLGKYKKTKNHWGFVHIDTRGYRARW